MKTMKVLALWICSLMLVLLVVQNTMIVRARFLWLTADVPVIMLLVFAATGGFVSGVLVALLLGNSAKSKQIKGEQHGRQETVSAEKKSSVG